jgi:hypothetical protein
VRAVVTATTMLHLVAAGLAMLSLSTDCIDFGRDGHLLSTGHVVGNHFPAAAAALPPFSFVVGGEDSASFLANCASTSSTHHLDADRAITTTIFHDNSTSLVVTLEVTTYANLMPQEPAVTATEWVLHFANNGSAATPAVCAIYGVNMSFPDSAGDVGATYVRRYAGSNDSAVDFAGVNETLTATAGAVDGSGDASGPNNYTWFYPNAGRSSDAVLPFFSVFNTGGTGYTISVGWSGSWTAALRRGDASGNGNGTHVWLRHDSGTGRCPGICTPLEPGESLRTMRVLAVAFPADGPDSYHLGVNAHRRLLARYKVPRHPTSATTMLASGGGGGGGGRREEGSGGSGNGGGSSGSGSGSNAPGAVLGAMTAALGWFSYPNCPNASYASQLSLVRACVRARDHACDRACVRACVRL